MAEDIKEIKETNRDIFKTLNGNGVAGLVTKVSILENIALTQPSVKIVMLYGSIGGGVTVILGFVLKAIIGS
jgi:seryl-tRNA synthetase